MNEPTLDVWSPESIVFGAVLTPHRSLSPHGFVVLMAAICAVSFGAGAISYLVGAWPVVGFLGLDVLLIFVAFRINCRQARRSESLHLTRRTLTVRRTDHRGRETLLDFQPSWLQVLIDDPPGHDSQLTLRSHGRSLTIGTFLTADERVDLANALRRALAEVRCAPGVA